MISKGCGQIKHKNKRAFHVSSTFFKLYIQLLKTNYRAYGFIRALPKLYIVKDLGETLNKITKD